MASIITSGGEKGKSRECLPGRREGYGIWQCFGVARLMEAGHCGTAPVGARLLLENGAAKKRIEMPKASLRRVLLPAGPLKAARSRTAGPCGF